MQLDGLHHITMITADAPTTVAFYADLLGLRMVKQTVNFDQPDAYHLYFSDELGSPGSILTWFEFPGARAGRAGTGMIHTLELGVASPASLDFWVERLRTAGRPVTRETESALRVADHDGLALVLIVTDNSNPPLRAVHPEIPAEHAVTGLQGVRAHARGELDADRTLLTETLGFTELAPGAYRLQGPTRQLRYRYDTEGGPGVPGAGTVHHIAWHSRDEDHGAWRARAHEAGMRVTDIIDRDYFHSIYFREPQGILFEIATTSPGFAVDEDPGHLGEQLRLPAQHAHLREQLQRTLAPLHNPRQRD